MPPTCTYLALSHEWGALPSLPAARREDLEAPSPQWAAACAEKVHWRMVLPSQFHCLVTEPEATRSPPSSTGPVARFAMVCWPLRPTAVATGTPHPAALTRPISGDRDQVESAGTWTSGLRRGPPHLLTNTPASRYLSRASAGVPLFRGLHRRYKGRSVRGHRGSAQVMVPVSHPVHRSPPAREHPEQPHRDDRPGSDAGRPGRLAGRAIRPR